MFHLSDQEKSVLRCSQRFDVLVRTFANFTRLFTSPRAQAIVLIPCMHSVNNYEPTPTGPGTRKPPTTPSHYAHPIAIYGNNAPEIRTPLWPSIKTLSHWSPDMTAVSYHCPAKRCGLNAAFQMLGIWMVPIPKDTSEKIQDMSSIMPLRRYCVNCKQVLSSNRLLTPSRSMGNPPWVNAAASPNKVSIPRIFYCLTR